MGEAHLLDISKEDNFIWVYKKDHQTNIIEHLSYFDKDGKEIPYEVLYQIRD